MEDFINTLSTFDYPCCYISGKRHSGKSYFLTERVLPNLRNKPDRIYVLKKTYWKTEGYEKFTNPDFIMDFDLKIVDLIMRAQKENMIKHKDNPERVPTIMLIMDDILDKYFFRRKGTSEIFEALFQRGRHYKIIVYVTSQHHTSLPVDFRDQSDLCVLKFQASANNLGNFRNDFLPTISETEFIKLATSIFREDIHNSIIYFPEKDVFIILPAKT